VITGDLLTATSSLSLAVAASVYASAGIPVFPCILGGKKPMTEHGFLDATADPVVVRRWWMRWPQANIGIPTGHHSGIDVVDVDVHNAPGPASFRRAAQAGLVGGWIATVRTPSGGMHAYFPCHPDRRQPSWQAANAGIDFRGTGGYIIAPPSRGDSSGQLVPYSVLAVAAERPHPVKGAALRDFLDPRPSGPRLPRHVSREDLGADRLASWVASRGEGERNRGLFWAACRLAEQGTDPSTMLAVLGPAAERAGLPESEITTTIRSAYRTTSPGPPARSDDHRPHRATSAAIQPRGLG
jgi:hypothetical protein